MKKKYVLTDLCCANCALKIEEAIKKIPGVEDAKISFIMKKMTLTANGADFDAVLEQAEKTGKNVDHDFEIIR